MNESEIKDYVVKYLIDSGFVYALVKKSLYPSLIDNYLDDYVSECWLAILEQKPSTWLKLYNTAKETGTDIEYQSRNYFSRVIFNTVKSTSSKAYNLLLKHNQLEKHQTDVQWEVYENTIPDPQQITELIRNQCE